MELEADFISKLRSIPAFVNYARERMAADTEFWEREAKFGSGGIMQATAAAVVEIAGSEGHEQRMG